MRGWIRLVKRSPNDEIRAKVDPGKPQILKIGKKTLKSVENRLNIITKQIRIEFSYPSPIDPVKDSLRMGPTGPGPNGISRI